MQNKKIITWCLKKAQQEINDKGIHKGLVRITPNKILAKKHLRKAEHNLRAAHCFVETEFSDWAASALFYSSYHCFLSILLVFGFESRNQECTRAVIESLLADKKVLFPQELLFLLPDDHDESIRTLREQTQYGLSTRLEHDKFTRMSDGCKELLSVTRQLVL